ERWMGVRWLTPAVTHVPAAPPASLPVIDFTYEPPFTYRLTNYLYTDPNLAAFRRAHRMHDGPGFSAHTVYQLVPPAEYFPRHPEYFSEVGGRRIAPWDFDWADPRTLHE